MTAWCRIDPHQAVPGNGQSPLNSFVALHILQRTPVISKPSVLIMDVAKPFETVLHISSVNIKFVAETRFQDRAITFSVYMSESGYLII